RSTTARASPRRACRRRSPPPRRRSRRRGSRSPAPASVLRLLVQDLRKVLREDETIAGLLLRMAGAAERPVQLGAELLALGIHRVLAAGAVAHLALHRLEPRHQEGIGRAAALLVAGGVAADAVVVEVVLLGGQRLVGLGVVGGRPAGEFRNVAP